MGTNRKTRRKFHVSHRAPGITLLLVISNLFFCSFEKPSAPTFETQINVPLISKVYEMQELVDDKDYLDVQNNGDLYFHVERTIERFYVDENLKINAIARNYSAEIGSFKINPPGQQSSEIGLGEIAPDLARSHGQTLEVLPFYFIPAQKKLESFPNFQEAHIDSGFAIIRIENNLNMSIGPPVNVFITQTGTAETIMETIFDEEIPPNSNKEISIDLGGKVLTSQMTIGFSGQCAGSKGEVITINSGTSVSVSIELTECKVSRAVAKIPQQFVRRFESIAMDDSLQIQDAKIENGNFVLNIRSALPVEALFTFTLIDFINPSGKALRDSFWVSPEAEYQRNIDLAGYFLHPETFQTDTRNLRLNWIFKTCDTGDAMVTLTNTDYMDANIEMSEIQFEYITGILSELKIEIEPYQHEIDIPSDLDSLLLDDAQMELQIQSSINFPGSSRLIIEGRNKVGQVIPLYVEEAIEPALHPGELANTAIILNKSNSQIVPFMNSLPSQIEIQGNVSLGEATWIGTIHKTDYIEGNLNLTTPLALALPGQRIELEPDSLDLDDDIREQIQNRLLEGALTGTIENHIPIAASLNIMFAPDSATVFSQPALTIGPIEIQAATVNTASGYAVQVKQSPIDVNLSEENLKIFEKPQVYVGLVFELPGSDGQIVRLHLNDFIQVNMALALKVKIGPNPI